MGSKKTNLVEIKSKTEEIVVTYTITSNIAICENLTRLARDSYKLKATGLWWSELRKPKEAKGFFKSSVVESRLPEYDYVGTLQLTGDLTSLRLFHTFMHNLPESAKFTCNSQVVTIYPGGQRIISPNYDWIFSSRP